MTKKKIFLEHLLQSKTKGFIWTMLTTPSGLSKWFADEVDLDGDTFTFKWGKEEFRTARILEITKGKLLTLHWLDDEEQHTFMRLEISQCELTQDILLKVTDFAEPDEAEELKTLWYNQLEALRRVSGV